MQANRIDGIANEDTTEMNLLEFKTAMKRLCDFCKVVCVEKNDDIVFEARGNKTKIALAAAESQGENRRGQLEQSRDAHTPGDAAIQLARARLKECDISGACAARDDAAEKYSLAGHDAHSNAVGNSEIAEVRLCDVCVSMKAGWV